jgi:hypothetical protein
MSTITTDPQSSYSVSASASASAPVPAPSRHAFTIVSAFMTQINIRDDRNIQKYIDFGHALLHVHIRQIIFLERDVFERSFCSAYRHLRKDAGANNATTGACSEYATRSFVYANRTYTYVVFGHLTFVFFEKTDMYLTAYRDLATEFSLQTPYPKKDTLDYMFVQCHKTEWLAIAISLDSALFGGSALDGMYVWMDFGIRHMYSSDIAFESAVYRLRDRHANAKEKWNRMLIYAPGCWDATRVYHQDIYRNVFWIFSGTSFGGSAGAILEFARRTREKCIELLTTKRHLMWEVNVWALVFRDCPALFSLFYGDHNASLLERWF